MTDNPIHDETVAAAGAEGDATPEAETVAAPDDDAQAADVAAPEPTTDGTVGDYDGDVRAFNNRPSTEYRDERGRVNTEAEFRSATGHDDSEQTDETNLRIHERRMADERDMAEAANR